MRNLGPDRKFHRNRSPGPKPENYEISRTHSLIVPWIPDPDRKCSCPMAAIIAMVVVLICNATGIVIIVKFYFWEKFDKENEIIMVNDISS